MRRVLILNRQLGYRYASTKAVTNEEPLVVSTILNGVVTLRLNRPKKLNGWTQPMMGSLMQNLDAAAKNSEVKAAILTGTDPYYCAGVDLGGSFKLMAPKTMLKMIEKDNQKIFDAFLDFPKPFIVAINGPAIGASVTSATLSDAIVASEKATFSTPFAKLGVTPEGCSSVHFERIMGKKNAERMLFAEGWKPTAEEAKEAGFVHAVFPHDKLMAGAQKLAEDWIAQGKLTRDLHTSGLLAELKAVNAKESKELAQAFLSTKFLKAQVDFANEKGKKDIARVFSIALFTRPIWSMFL